MPTFFKDAILYFENSYIIPGISYIIYTLPTLKFQRKHKRQRKDDVFRDSFLPPCNQYNILQIFFRINL